MRDFLPAGIRKRNYVIGIIKDVYESYGFEPLETPAVENLPTLMGKYGDEGNQLIYKILKRGEKLEKELESYRVAELRSSVSSTINEISLADLALRYDLTVPLARVVANNRNELPKFFKRYQIQPVWRADRPARGRYREFYQCDVDAIGSASMVVEAELIGAVDEILCRLGFDDFIIRLNHRELLRGMLEAADIDKDLHNEALVALDKLDKIGAAGFLNEFLERGIEASKGEKLLKLFSELETLDLREKLDLLSKFVGTNEAGKAGLKELTQIIDFSTSIRLSVDASLARGLSYYTGTIIEVNVPDFGGSLAGGGRYDNLIGMFGKEQIPACGVSLGLERILVVMDESGMFPPEIAESNAADVMVTITDESGINSALKLAGELRAKGVRVTVYPNADKLAKQFKYASQIAVPYVCVIRDGDSELKDMKTGEQKVMTIDQIAKIFVPNF